MEASAVILAIILAQGDSAASYKAAEASARLYNVDYMLDAKSKELVSEENRRKLGNAIIVVDITVNRRVVFNWRF